MEFYIPKRTCFSQRFKLLVQKLSGIEVGETGWRKQLRNWVALHPEKWWQGVWIACEIKGDPGQYQPNDPLENPNAVQIFANAKINIAENIFTFGPLNDDSLIAWAEDGPRSIWSRAHLKEMAGRFATAFHELGLQSGDRIVINLPDVPQKIAAFLGASWMGLVSVIEPPWSKHNGAQKTAWAQFSPKLILTCDGYRRAGVWVDRGDFLQELLVTKAKDVLVVPVPCAGTKRDVQSFDGIFNWEKFDRLGKGGGYSYHYISFSQELAHIYENQTGEFTQIISGQWLLGALIQWLLWADIGGGAHIFVADITEQSKWLQLVASLATGSDSVLFNGDHEAMNGQVLWRIIEREQAKVVRVSQNLLIEFQKSKQPPISNHQLDCVELVLVEGPLSKAQQDFLKKSCFINAKVSEL